jgi:hypothetical protein
MRTLPAIACGALLASAAHGGEGYCETVDLNGCGCVDVSSLLLLLSQWGETGSPADFDGDGTVGGFDLGYLLAHFSHVFPSSECLAIPQAATEMPVIVVDETDDEARASGFREFAVFVPFAGPDAAPLNVYDAQFVLVGADAWVHTDAYADEKDTSAWNPEPQIHPDPCVCDSYVTIGFDAGNSTSQIDPDFMFADPADLSGVGWFTLPGVVAGKWPQNEVLLARFVMPVGAVTQGDLLLLWRSGQELHLGHIAFDTPSAADLNGDGLVDGADLGLVLAGWGGAGAVDIDGNGSVGGEDLGLVLAAWTR